MEMMVAWCSDLVFKCPCRHLKGEAAYNRASGLFLTSAINLLRYCPSATFKLIVFQRLWNTFCLKMYKCNVNSSLSLFSNSLL